jgi:hypothetical protein
MKNNLLYVFVEGDDDKRFFENILKPILSKIFSSIPIEYSGLTQKKVNEFIKSIQSMKADYLFLHDLDYNPCITQCKLKIKLKFNTLDEEKLIIIDKEIESWYLAGLDEVKSKQLGLVHLKTTDDLTKEKFNELIPAKYRSSRIDFMIEILKHYSIKIAKRKNKSFTYFSERHDPQVAQLIAVASEDS